MKFYLNQLKPEALKIVREVGTISQELGLRAFVTGGCVRDLILGRSVEELDIVIQGDAIQVAKKFASRHEGKLTVYSQFGTATVVLSSGRIVDFASVRKEVYPHPGALPVVSQGSLEEDLFRRDFTINAMAIAVDPAHFGCLLDHYGGIVDLKKKRVRVLHNQSFVDDPTRIFRAVRFEQRFQFAIEPVTLRLLRQAMKSGALNTVKPPRLFEEFKKNLKEQAALRNIERLSEFGVLKRLVPGVPLTKAKVQLIKQVDRALLWGSKNLSDRNDLNGWLIYWMAVCDGISRPQLVKIMESFALTNLDKTKTIAALTSQDAISKIALRNLSKPGAFALLRSKSKEELLFFWAKCSKGPARARIEKYLLEWRFLDLKITGEDIKRLGVPSGRIFKDILDRVLDQVVEGRCRLKSEQLAYARRCINKVSC